MESGELLKNGGVHERGTSKGRLSQTNEEVFIVDAASSPRSLLGGIRLQYFQPLNNMIVFTIFLALFSILQGVLVNGIVLASLVSIEREFGFSSQQTGIIVGGNDMAALMFVGLVSFFGTKGDKPLWLGVGAMVTGAGSALFALPKLISGVHTISQGLQNISVCTPMEAFPNTAGSSIPSDGNIAYLAIFLVAQFLMGVGTTPLYTLGPAYLDENVSPSSSPIYLGIWYASTMFGPGLGFVVGSLFLKTFTDVKPPAVMGGYQLDNTDPRWVGAWWLPFAAFSGLFVIVGFALVCFPREMPEGKILKQKSIAEGQLPGEDREIEFTIRGMFLALWKLARNWTFVFAVCALTAKTLFGTGLATFFSKLLVLKFGAAQHESSLYIGIVMVPAMVLSILGGSLLMKRVNVKGSAGKGARFCFIASLLTSVACLTFAIPGCRNTNMAGVTVPYQNNSKARSLDSDCNWNCSCKIEHYMPVCGSDGVTYHNPCFAGCTIVVNIQRSKSDKPWFGNCKCIPSLLTQNHTMMAISALYPTKIVAGSLSTTSSSEDVFSNVTSQIKLDELAPSVFNKATLGKCDRNCKNLLVFLLSVAAVVSVSFFTGTPHKMIILRSVPDNQRSFALGISFLVMRSFSFLPGPIILGSVIDSKCFTWGYNQRMEKTICYDHDVDALSWNIVLFAGITGIIGSTCYLLSWLLYKAPPEEVRRLDENINLVQARSESSA